MDKWLPRWPETGCELRANGDLACQFELNKAYQDPTPWRHASVLLFSKDGGNSRGEHAITSGDLQNRIFYWDQRPSVLPSGSILNLYWTFDRQRSIYRDIHARQSDDHGRTWSQMWSTGVAGQPAPPLLLADGMLGMVYVDRTASPMIKMRMSGDGGRTWPRLSEIVLDQLPRASQLREKQNMVDAWAEMANLSIGLPATAMTQSGDVLVVYYLGPSADQTDIKWVRVRATALPKQ